MARIQEYLPQEGAAGPVGGTSPALEAVGQYGAGIEKFGRAVTETADAVESRMGMMESADAQAQAAETKAGFFDRVKEETNNGTLDQNKLFNDYDEWVDKTGSEYSTSRGKSEFKRATGRMRGSLIRWAAQGQAQIAGANAIADHTTAINSLTDLTQKDPHSFPDNMGQLDEYHNGLKQDGNMNKNPQALEKLFEADRAQLATAAVQGQMNVDFDAVVADMVANGGKVDPTNPKYGLAKGMLDKGVFDQYLDSSKKEALQKNIRTNFTAAQTEGQRILNVKEAERVQQTEQWEQGAVSKWTNNQLSIRDVLKSPMDAKDKIRWVNMVKESQKSETKTDPHVMNDITSRILSADNEPGHISDASQLSDYVGKGLSAQDYIRAKALIGASGQGQVDRNNERQLVDLAKAKLVNANPMLGIKDPDGQYKLMLFTNALQQAKQEAISQGKTVNSVLDPNSKDFFGNRIQQYVPTPQEILKKQADQVRGNFVPPTTVETQPGTTPTPGAAPTDDQLITMYKGGKPRQIYKSKQKQAEAAGYSVK